MVKRKIDEHGYVSNMEVTVSCHVVYHVDNHTLCSRACDYIVQDDHGFHPECGLFDENLKEISGTIDLKRCGECIKRVGFPTEEELALWYLHVLRKS